MDYQSTLNLPKTDFPMRANLFQKEPLLLKKWADEDLYAKIRQQNVKNPKFILHDGPLYANGNIHLGHALNKILKDIIIKVKTMEGYDSPYIPGWDCHGLPIEHQVMKKLGKKGRGMPRNEIRKLCREYAQKFVAIQKDEFIRLGVFGDFDNPYLTMSREYEASIIDIFAQIFAKGFIYRGRKPIYWSPTSVTALAEAEIEYKDIESPSIYVKFPVQSQSISGDFPHKDKTFVVIWTTTPWTIPANLAVCFNPDLAYSLYCCGASTAVEEENYIIAEGLAENFFRKIGQKILSSVKLDIDFLKNIKVSHPFIDRESKVVFGKHVTLESGTGIVHTAPGHGHDDYEVGLSNNLEIYCPVDEYGRFTEDFPQMQGVKVFDADLKIIDLLQTKGMLLKHETITHSYPHGWRDKKPVIFRATYQWFFKIDHLGLREKGLQAIKNTKWNPLNGQNRIESMIEGRPDWCLSRQRAWGVPIPAFKFLETGEILLSQATIEHFLKIISEEGLDSWFTKEAHELLPDEVVCAGKTFKGDARIGKFKQEEDILDVWFDSGVSSFAVLSNRENLRWPADVYLEGSDQHRGWFQSSLWPAVALKGAAPYKQVITHGFILDENGQAMSKSQGNTIAPEQIIQKYGADILRLWVASENYQNDIKHGWNLMGQVADSYRKIRNSFRFLLGNLYDFGEEDIVSFDELSPLDKWALYILFQLNESVRKAYAEEGFHRVFHLFNNFFISDMSTVYFDISKDILYCDEKNSIRRRSVQTVLHQILETSLRLLAPILCFTAEEIYLKYLGKKDSIHLETFLNLPEEWGREQIPLEIKKLMDARVEVQKALENLREQKVIGKSLEASIEVFCKNEELLAILTKYEPFLKELFIVSYVNLSKEKPEGGIEGELMFIKAFKAPGEKCPRCWFVHEQSNNNSAHPSLCKRCLAVVKK